MARIYRISERIPLRVGDLEIQISPLALDQKAEISDVVGDGMSTAKLLRGSALALKYCVKSVSGLEDGEGAYSLEFQEDGNLSDDAVNELFNMQGNDKLTAICLSLLNGIPEEFMDPLTGEPLKGVEFIVEKEAPRKKRKAASSK